MNPTLRPLIVCSLLALSGTARVLAQHESMPAGMTHEEHMAQMQKDAELKTRGAASMGFDQDTTRHHFTLDATGGAIAVDVVDRSSAVTRAEVRAHLSEIAAQFAQGDFTKPFDTHGEVPPGTSTMAERRGTLTFRYEDTPGGGRVRIATADARALEAVHEFLRYQIREHKTGDPLTVD